MNKKDYTSQDITYSRLKINSYIARHITSPSSHLPRHDPLHFLRYLYLAKYNTLSVLHNTAYTLPCVTPHVRVLCLINHILLLQQTPML